jgi:hypothetical protein
MKCMIVSPSCEISSLDLASCSGNTSSPYLASPSPHPSYLLNPNALSLTSTPLPSNDNLNLTHFHNHNLSMDITCIFPLKYLVILPIFFYHIYDLPATKDGPTPETNETNPLVQTPSHSTLSNSISPLTLIHSITNIASSLLHEIIPSPNQETNPSSTYYH